MRHCFTAAMLFLLACNSGAGEEELRFQNAAVGAAEPVRGFREKLQAKWIERRKADYKPRTRHLHEDGTPKYTNRLLLESSPYLLQHAHNPVNWYPWGDEAFETARELGRPVLLSVGYSTCHWCHVMEEESFEDEEVARYLNENYVAIKVDREERPDVDAIYMAAVQAFSGRGGWPMTVWLTPERKPFFGGTYFPARDGDRGARMGFLTLLARPRDAYETKREDVTRNGEIFVQQAGQLLAPAPAEGVPGVEVLTAASSFYAERFDAANGGLKGAPKFPSSLPVRYLLREWRRTGEKRWRDMAELTLTRMARGGIYDQVGGGFHRYSTDGKWLVPHFEKMLYDNALLTVAYIEGFQATGREEFARVARETLRYVARDMTSPEGAFYSATDADSLNPEGEREEGWFFTWTPEELRAVLGEEEAKRAAAHYGVTGSGNFEGRSILFVTTADNPDFAEVRENLYRARLERPAPLRDEKILAAWNGLMVSAHAVAALALGEPEYARRAAKAADFVLTKMRRNGRLLRSYKDGEARLNAYLDDYAFVLAGLLDLFEATGEERWVREAVALDRVLAEHYEDPAGGFFLTSNDHEQLLAREKPAQDGAEPSGNSVAALNLLLRLHALTADDDYRRRAERTLQALGTVLERSPAALSEMLLVVEFQYGEPKEIVIVTPNSGSAEPMLEVLRNRFLPNRVLVVTPEHGVTSLAAVVPIAEGKTARGGKATAYVCKGGVCELPVTDPAALISQLEKK